MKKLIYILLICIFNIQASGQSHNVSSNNIAGIYKTGFGEMTLNINGNHVTGNYKNAGGKIDGILTGKVLKGTWTQTNGKGKIEFVFNTNFSVFKGKWSYNNAAPSGVWNGTKTSTVISSHTKIPSAISNNNNIAGIYKTDFNEMTLRINGNRVTGTYKYSGGKIEGILTGHILKGTWTQTNGKGKIEFIFNANFSAFTGKYGYNNAAPSSKWNGTKISSTSSTGTSNSSSSSSGQSASISISKKHFQQNESIVISFTAPAGLSNYAWIGIIPSSIKHGDENINDQYDVSYQYLYKKTSGMLTFKAPQKNGNWDLRMNSADGGGKELTSTSFTVGDVHSEPINQPPTSSQTIVGNEIFHNGNRSGVVNGVKSNTYFYVGKTTTISSISNYHWNNGKGSQPGKIGLRNSQGSILGTWQSVGSDGMGGVKNANWTVYPNITIQTGIYLITDSEPSTWSQNKGSYGAGFSTVNDK